MARSAIRPSVSSTPHGEGKSWTALAAFDETLNENAPVSTSAIPTEPERRVQAGVNS